MSGGLSWIRAFALHQDPLVEASNWAALAIGTHLPFWPLYVLWAAGSQAMPSALLTVSMAPVFLVLPLLSRRSGLWGRIAMLLAGNANTVLTVWILGENTGTDLFFVPCSALAAILFRRSERWIMLFFTMLPVFVWYLWQGHTPAGLHHYDTKSAREIFHLNALSIGVLIAVFGWLQAGVYRRMERPRAP